MTQPDHINIIGTILGTSLGLLGAILGTYLGITHYIGGIIKSPNLSDEAKFLGVNTAIKLAAIMASVIVALGSVYIVAIIYRPFGISPAIYLPFITMALIGLLVFAGVRMTKNS